MKPREIKFRFFDKKNNRMNQCNWKEYIDYLSKFFIEYDNALPNVHLMQYTGLKDRNMVDIYEGDMLENETMKGGKIIGPVRWGRYQFYKGEMVTWVASPIALIPDTFKESILHDCEIVGNIYENPELLK